MSMTREAKFNILRGIIVSSFLDNEEKTEIIEFISELESVKAYDIEKVVEQIKRELPICTGKAIEIVRKGGKE